MCSAISSHTWTNTTDCLYHGVGDRQGLKLSSLVSMVRCRQNMVLFFNLLQSPASLLSHIPPLSPLNFPQNITCVKYFCLWATFGEEEKEYDILWLELWTFVGGAHTALRTARQIAVCCCQDTTSCQGQNNNNIWILSISKLPCASVWWFGTH